MNQKTCPIRGDWCCPTDCAWWDANSQSCAVLLLAQRFDAVTTGEDELLVTSGQLLSSDIEEALSCLDT